MIARTQLGHLPPISEPIPKHRNSRENVARTSGLGRRGAAGWHYSWRLGVGPNSIILTTDADAVPARSWVEKTIKEMQSDGEVVCGMAEIHPQDAEKFRGHRAPDRALAELLNASIPVATHFLQARQPTASIPMFFVNSPSGAMRVTGTFRISRVLKNPRILNNRTQFGRNLPQFLFKAARHCARLCRRPRRAR
jgi:Glycosyl transferase family 2